MNPAFSHFRNMAVSIGICANNQSWLMPSKQARMSPSKSIAAHASGLRH